MARRAVKMATRVRHGVAFLDGVLGPRWPFLIDLDSFQIDDTCNCVLAQLNEAETGGNADYDDGVSEFLDGNEVRAIDFGFNIDGDEWGYGHYSTLQQAWVDQINKLRQERSRVPA